MKLRKASIWTCLLVLCLATVGASAALAQRIDGDLRGVVKDPSGAVVPGAKITITNQATGLSRTTETTDVGVWVAANLLPGDYQIQVEGSGFKTAVRRNVVVVANRVIEVNIDLELGQASQTVTVESGAELVETQGATLAGGTFRGPLLTGTITAMGGSITGDVRNLAVIAPGTTTQPGGVAGQGGAIGGNRPRNNSFTVDGLDNNDPSVTGANGPVINEAVQEFTLLTNQFAAEFGHSTAGQFILTTKSGTNELHGQAWWYNQHRSRNSLDNLTRAGLAPGDDKPRFDVNRLGGQAGGPILRDRWFYFGAYEFQNVGLAGTAGSVIQVPTAAGLSTLQSLAGQMGTGISPVNVGILTANAPTASTATTSLNVCNELTNPTCDPAGPLVSIPLGQFSASTPQFLNTHLFQIGQDWQQGNHKVTGRYHWSRQRSIFPGSLPVAQFNSNTLFDTQRLTLSHVWTLGTRAVNELRLGWMRRVGPDQVLQNLAAPAGTDTFGNYAIQEMGLNIGPQSNFPQGQSGNTYQFADNVSYVRGRHSFKFGVDVRNILRTGGFLPRARGDFSWAADATGNTPGARNVSGLDGFVRDLAPTNVSIRGVGTANFTQNRTAWYGFAQDSWRIHPRFTLDYGIRYEFVEPTRDSLFQDLNGLADITSITGDPIFATLSARHQQELLSHVGERLIFKRPDSDRNNWAPRLGLAWDVFGDGKTSFRAGVSRGFDVLFGNLALLQLPPQLQAENREGNACVLQPSPAWCAQTAGTGNPRADAADIRWNTTGFIEGGGLLPVLPLTTSTSVAAARAATGNFVVDEKTPETWTWTASLQREFWKNWIVEARYVGTRALYLPIQRWKNAGIPVYFEGLQLPVFTSMSEVPATFAAGDLTQAGFAAQATNRVLLPFGFGGVLTEFAPVGRSTYHGGSLRVERRFSDGLLVTGSYTWSRTIDLGDNELFTSVVNPRRPFNHNDPNTFRGLSALHRAHKFALAWVYEIPRYRGDSAFIRGFANGWTYAGALLAESGQPVTILAGRDIDGNLDTAGDFAFHNPGGTSGVGADSIAVCRAGAGALVPVGASVIGCNRTTLGLAANANLAPFIVGYVSAVDNAEWIRPGLGGVTHNTRGVHIAGGIHNWNMEITKRTPFWGEGRYIDFSAQFVNIFNHSSFSVGTGSVLGLNTPAQTNTGYVTPGAANFLKDDTFSGSLGQAPFQRVIQFALKVIF